MSLCPINCPYVWQNCPYVWQNCPLVQQMSSCLIKSPYAQQRFPMTRSFPMVPHTTFQFLMASSPDHFLWSLTQLFNSWWHLCQITSYGPLHKISIYDGIFAWSFPMVPLTTFQLFVAFRLVLNLWTLKQFLNSSWPFARFVKTDFYLTPFHS